MGEKNMKIEKKMRGRARKCTKVYAMISIPKTFSVYERKISNNMPEKIQLESTRKRDTKKGKKTRS